MSGAISLPSDERNGGVKDSLNQARHWFDKKWNGDNSETAPLLNRERGTLEPPRKTTFRIVVTSVLLIIALVVLGLVAGIWFKHHENKLGTKIQLCV